MSTLSQLQTECSNILGDPTNLRFSLADILTYLNEAADEFARLTGLFRLSVTLPTVVGQAAYLIVDTQGNNPVGEVLRVEDATGAQLNKTTKGELDDLYSGNLANWTLEQGNPRNWLPQTGTYGEIIIFPKPVAIQNLTIWFPAQSIPMAGANDTPFAGTGAQTLTQYHYALPFYAAWKCLIRSQDSEDEPTAEKRRAFFDGVVKQAQNDPAYAA